MSDWDDGYTAGYDAGSDDGYNLGRADEREAWLLVAAIDKVRMDDLRGKVTALPGSHWVGTAWVLRDDVLALLDGGST